MIQSLDKQLQVVIRALGDVVTPALEGGEKHVLEQLQVSMATLAFVLKRLPEARRFYRHELKSYLGLADALLAASPEVLADARAELERFAGEGRATLDRPEADLADFELATRRLRESVARLADAAQDAALRRQPRDHHPGAKRADHRAGAPVVHALRLRAEAAEPAAGGLVSCAVLERAGQGCYRLEHDQFRETVRRFIADEFTPRLEAFEADGKVSRDFWRKAGRQGLALPQHPGSLWRP